MLYRACTWVPKQQRRPIFMVRSSFVRARTSLARTKAGVALTVLVWLLAAGASVVRPYPRFVAPRPPPHGLRDCGPAATVVFVAVLRARGCTQRARAPALTCPRASRSFFTERDPAYSMELRTETVPSYAAALLAYLFPLLTMLSWYALDRKRNAGMARVMRAHGGVLSTVLAFNQATAVTLLVTTLAKGYVGSLRPNAFALCNYKGYRDALASSNLTQYDALTEFGRVGHMTDCRASRVSLCACAVCVRGVRGRPTLVVSVPACVRTPLTAPAQLFAVAAAQSFPSGHASFSCAGLGFLAMLTFKALATYHVVPQVRSTGMHTRPAPGSLSCRAGNALPAGLLPVYDGGLHQRLSHP